MKYTKEKLKFECTYTMLQKRFITVDFRLIDDHRTCTQLVYCKRFSHSLQVTFPPLRVVVALIFSYRYANTIICNDEKQKKKKRIPDLRK